jgi:anti-anti-sigma factor
MDINATKDGDILIIGLKGRLDANTSPSLEDRLVGLIDGGQTRFLVEFTEVDYISSAGLRVLLMVAKRLKNVNGRIVLASLKDHIKEVFDIAGFSSVLTIYASEKDAKASFS